MRLLVWSLFVKVLRTRSRRLLNLRLGNVSRLLWNRSWALDVESLRVRLDFCLELFLWLRCEESSWRRWGCWLVMEFLFFLCHWLCLVNEAGFCVLYWSLWFPHADLSWTGKSSAGLVLTDNRERNSAGNIETGRRWAVELRKGSCQATELKQVSKLVKKKELFTDAMKRGKTFKT
jgi:hypothetical protein